MAYNHILTHEVRPGSTSLTFWQRHVDPTPAKESTLDFDSPAEAAVAFRDMINKGNVTIQSMGPQAIEEAAQREKDIRALPPEEQQAARRKYIQSLMKTKEFIVSDATIDLAYALIAIGEKDMRAAGKHVFLWKLHTAEVLQLSFRDPLHVHDQFEQFFSLSNEIRRIRVLYQDQHKTDLTDSALMSSFVRGFLEEECRHVVEILGIIAIDEKLDILLQEKPEDLTLDWEYVLGSYLGGQKFCRQMLAQKRNLPFTHALGVIYAATQNSSYKNDPWKTIVTFLKGYLEEQSFYAKKVLELVDTAN